MKCILFEKYEIKVIYFYIHYDSWLVFIIFNKRVVLQLRTFSVHFTSTIAICFCRKVDHFTLCCHVEKRLPNVICKSLVGYGVSSCDELLKNKVLTYCIWVLGVTAFVGNLVVILWRLIGRDINRVNSFLLVGNRLHSLDANYLKTSMAQSLILFYYFPCMFCIHICTSNRKGLKIKTVMAVFSETKYIVWIDSAKYTGQSHRTKYRSPTNKYRFFMSSAIHRRKHDTGILLGKREIKISKF